MKKRKEMLFTQLWSVYLNKCTEQETLYEGVIIPDTNVAKFKKIQNDIVSTLGEITNLFSI